MKTLGEPEIVISWAGKEQNVYRREVLYQKIWSIPVTEMAKKYAVSDVMIHKICRSMDIPTPPSGYWAKRRAGQEVEIPPLPPSACKCKKLGLRTKKQGTLSLENNGAAVAPLWKIPQTMGCRNDEEHQQREIKRKRYHEEVVRTRVLMNMAKDYEIVCRIRALVAAEELKGTADTKWAEWAKAKADWFDPTVAVKDEVFGRRNHKLNAEQKVPKDC